MTTEKKPAKKKIKAPIIETPTYVSSLTTQQIFETVLAHLRQQKKKAYDDPTKEGEAAYISSNGAQCSIGCLIKKEEYNPIFEHYLVNQMLHLPEAPLSLKERLIPHLDNWFLKDIQDVHDIYQPEEWEDKMQALAIKHKLKWIPK